MQTPYNTKDLKKIFLTWPKVWKGKYAHPSTQPTDKQADFGWVEGGWFFF